MPVDTKQIIVDAYIELSKHKNVDKITVKDIVEACNISRQTFYYHFQDITEAIEWYIEQKLNQQLENSSLSEEPYQVIRSFVAIAVENRIQRRRMMNSQHKDHFERILVQNSREYLKKIVRCYPLSPQIEYANWEDALDFCAWGMAGFIIQNDYDKQVDIDKISKQVYQILSCFIPTLPEIK